MTTNVESVDLLRGTFGCPCGRHVRPDPYPQARDWHAAASGDGGTYSGVVGTVARRPDETESEFRARVNDECARLEAEYGVCYTTEP